MTEQDINTEEKILLAATEVFIKKGKDAARMQEIADEAGINKALLHYYYRSKEKLFEAVFHVVVKQLVLPKVIKTLEEEENMFELIRKFCNFYIDLLIKNPFIPLFIIEELNKNPQWFSNTLIKAGIPIDKAICKLEDAMENGKIRKMDPRHIMVNLVSLSVFPFAAREIIRPVMFANDKKHFKQFLESRKAEVADFIINAIKL